MTSKSKTAKTAAAKATKFVKKVAPKVAKAAVKAATKPVAKPVVKASAPVKQVETKAPVVKAPAKVAVKKPVPVKAKVIAKPAAKPVVAVKTISMTKINDQAARSKLVLPGTSKPVQVKAASVVNQAASTVKKTVTNNRTVSMHDLAASIRANTVNPVVAAEPKAIEVKAPVVNTQKVASSVGGKSVSVQELFSRMAQNATPSFIK